MKRRKVAKRRPPNLRRASNPRSSCHTCASMNRSTGLCARYLWPVTRQQTCDTWRARGQR